MARLKVRRLGDRRLGCGASGARWPWVEEHALKISIL